MVRSYLRHDPTAAFGVICSNTARSLLDADGKTAYVPALEDVLVWDVRRGEMLSMWHEQGHRSPVTALARCPSASGSHLFAVGYQDGSIRLWDSTTSAAQLTFSGHRKAVVSLAFDGAGMRLASGSQDTTVIVWDLVAESGLFRLKGHRDAVTDLAFTRSPSSAQQQQHDDASTSAAVAAATADAAGPGFLLTISKDGLLKVWDLALQHCISTTVPGKGELWSLAVMEIPAATPEEGSADEALTPPQDHLVVTGSSEGEAKLWLLRGEALAAGLQALTALPTADAGAKEEDGKLLLPQGNLTLASQRRVTQIAFSAGASTTSAQSKTTPYLALSSSDRSVQVFRLRGEDEMRKKLLRRKRRQREKAGKKGGRGGDDDDDDADDATLAVSWLDRIEPYTIVRPESGRLRSFAFPQGFDGRPHSATKASAGAGLPLLCATHANSLEVHAVPRPKSSAEKKASASSSSAAAVEPSLSCALDLPGHRSEVRALGLSSDDALLASADSAGTLKIWNVKTGRCIRTLPCGYALSLAWLPGDRYVVVGCKDGTLRTYDVPAGAGVEVISAHTGPVWSVALHPEGQSCVSASADKDVKFWEFEMQAVDDGSDEEGEGEGGDRDDGADGDGERAPRRARPEQLALTHVRTLKMTDDVLFARYSPNGKLLALSLLDNTVKVFYADSLKFFLSLYGHKLPVLSLDISVDSKLAVTVSADKNVKIWGLDFGDCHRSIFAHGDSIMACGFERGSQGGGLLGGREGASHHFWTVGKDGLVKYWDGDRFELIQTLEGHHGEVWALAVGAGGTLAVTTGADRSIRTWEKGEEPLFLEEEREREQEKLFDAAEREARDRAEAQVGAVGSLAGGTAGAAGPGGTGQGPEGEEQQEATAVTLQTSQTLMAGERLIEALDLADEDAAAGRAWVRAGRRGAAPPRSAIVLAAFPEGSVPSTAGLSAPSGSEGQGQGRSQGQGAPGAGHGKGEDEEEDPVPQLYVLRVVERILPAHLEDALLTLPFDKVLSLLRYLDAWARMSLGGRGGSVSSRRGPGSGAAAAAGGSGSGRQSGTAATSVGPTVLPLLSRILFFLLRTHHSQLISGSGSVSGSGGSSKSTRRVLTSLRANLRRGLERQKAVLGYNLVGLRELRRVDAERRVGEFYEREGFAFDGDESEVRRRVAEEGGGVTRKRKANVA